MGTGGNWSNLWSTNASDYLLYSAFGTSGSGIPNRIHVLNSNPGNTLPPSGTSMGVQFPPDAIGNTELCAVVLSLSAVAPARLMRGIVAGIYDEETNL